MEHIVENSPAFRETLDMSKAVGRNVLSKEGTVLGKVTNIQVHPNTMDFEGLVVKGSRGKVFFGRNYVNKLTQDGVILKIDPFYLLEGRKVLSRDGEFLGKVKKVNRHGHSNELKSIIIKKVFKNADTIPASNISSIKTSIVLR